MEDALVQQVLEMSEGQTFRPVLPLALVGQPPDWLPQVLQDMVNRSARGRWTECNTVCAISQEAVDSFCSIVRDTNRLHRALGTQRSIVPGALIANMLPALMPEVFSACEQTGTLLDAGGQRVPAAIIKTEVPFQARIRVVSTRYTHDKNGDVTPNSFFEVTLLAVVYTTATDTANEVERVRVTQTIQLRPKASHRASK